MEMSSFILDSLEMCNSAIGTVWARVIGGSIDRCIRG